ncbi:hypothetical protein ABPG75_010644 [Micractinium tetrahymenae]
MPPRSRVAASAAGAPLAPSATIADLPDELLALPGVGGPGGEVMGSATLVCKRFCRACATLPLDIRITNRSRGASSAARLLALHAFLAKQGPALRSLRLDSWASGTAGQEEAAALTACLEWSSAAGSPLERLDVTTALNLHIYGDVGLPVGCMQLTALADVELSGWSVQFEAPALPPGITRLYLRDESTQLPHQLCSLHSLARLEPSCDNLEAGSLRMLSSLQSLTSLLLPAAAPPLAGLALEAVTQLQQLNLVGLYLPDGAAGLEAVLLALRGLRTLSLSFPELDRIPPSLGSLPRLERLCLEYDVFEGGEGALTLPPGPCLSSLRLLIVPCEVLCARAGVLRGATALAHISCFGLPVPGGEDLLRMTDIPASLPALPLDNT